MQKTASSSSISTSQSQQRLRRPSATNSVATHSESNDANSNREIRRISSISTGASLLSSSNSITTRLPKTHKKHDEKSTKNRALQPSNNNNNNSSSKLDLNLRKSALEASIESLRSSTEATTSTLSSLPSSSELSDRVAPRLSKEKYSRSRATSSSVSTIQNRILSSAHARPSDATTVTTQKSDESLNRLSSAGSSSSSNDTNINNSNSSAARNNRISSTISVDSIQRSEISVELTASSSQRGSSSDTGSSSSDSENSLNSRHDRRKSKSRDRHSRRSDSTSSSIDPMTPLIIAASGKKIRPGIKKLRIDTNLLTSRKQKSRNSDDGGGGEKNNDLSRWEQRNYGLPPLPKSPIPKSPGQSLVIAETDLLTPTATTTSTARARKKSQSATAIGVENKTHTPEIVVGNDNNNDDDEADETEEEHERLRALLSSSAALAGRRKKRKSTIAKMGTDSADIVVVAGTAVGVANEDGGGVSGGGGGGGIYAQAAETYAAPVFEAGEPDILFVDDGTRFRHLRRSKIGDEKTEQEELHSFDEQLHRLCSAINTTSSHFLQTGHGIYAGLCLLSVALFPTTVPLVTPTASSYENVSAFIEFYSPVSTPTSRLFSVVGTLAVVGAFDGGMENSSEGVDRLGKWWRAGNRVSSIGACVSYICSIAMVPVDDRLYESQMGIYGGAYGTKNWFVNETTTASFGTAAALPFTETITAAYDLTQQNTTFGLFYPTAGADITFWQNMNCARGIFGVASWMFCCLARMMREKKRKRFGGGGAVEHHWGAGRGETVTQNRAKELSKAAVPIAVERDSFAMEVPE
ncbi:hypothetical protein HK100_005030 [Physocladia obscura]|uniref:Uncharacterized protein n=1 Tax=Physocladia obscura TaxID=109957 RepID=A0AAD5XC64_9FUNG|nr:hypothetical protein HK100_005030 [Physocladia obscura]